MVRLRTTSPNQPGWTRRRAGRGFTYLDEHGGRLAPDDVERVRNLVIPPAWKDVWISPYANGHLQAVGVDEAGRRQYLYHPAWRVRQDELKFERVARAARRQHVRRSSSTSRGRACPWSGPPPPPYACSTSATSASGATPTSTAGRSA